jgi:hypothetical protein
MKKIGILTFHTAHNYGAVLQCYALQEMLKSMGHAVEVIDYQPRYIEDAYRLFSYRGQEASSFRQGIKLLLRDLLLCPVKHIRARKFTSFVKKYLNLSTPVHGREILPCYDVYIVGSDQIWNKAITKGYDKVYFCDFHFEKQHRKYISYAASTELSDFSAEDSYLLNTHLEHLDAISVRESGLAEFIKINLDKEVDTVIDPTLLHDKTFWDKLVEMKNNRGDYILLYQARYSAELVVKAEEIATSMNCRLVEMSAWTIPLARMHKDGMAASPLEFIDLIRNAKLVLNTSFHGTVFSVIYGVPFYYVALSDGWDLRATSLLRELNLADRILHLEACTADVCQTQVDFSQTQTRLESLRERSKQFLLNNIQ